MFFILFSHILEDPERKVFVVSIYILLDEQKKNVKKL